MSTLTLTPLRSGLPASQESTLTVLVRARAPEDPGGHRPRRSLNLSIVIDRSGSMSGDPLREARRCAEHIVRGLDPHDIASVVAYDNRVDVLAPSQPVGDRRNLLRAIDCICSGGATALYDGWRLGADQALFAHEADALSRVLLLSDGNANSGITNSARIAKRVADARQRGVTTSTYGLGHSFNEDLMMRMGRAGGGNSYYGESAEDLIDPFREELDLLNALFARRLSLALDTPRGVEFRVLNDYDRDRKGRWCLPDLAFGGEAWALVELKISQRLASKRTQETELLSASLKLRPEEERPTRLGPVSLRLPFLCTQACSSLAEDKTVRARGQEVRAAGIQEEARLAARRGDWCRVEELLDIARREAADNPWLESALEGLARYAERRQTAAFSKEALYSSHRMLHRLADPQECSDDYDLGDESRKASFLRRKRQQGKRLERSGSPS